MNRDIVTGSIEESQTLNRYAYVNGNPVSYHDPFGLARELLTRDSIQSVLDFVGLIPGWGAIADLTNAGIHGWNGEWSEAGQSAFGAIPGVGDAATVAKISNRTSKIIDNAADSGKINYKKTPEGLSPNVYPNPDPPMNYSPVRYEPESIEEVVRMRQGKGPRTRSTHGDKNIEAHHRQQRSVSNGGILDELEQRTHRGKGNHTRHNRPSELTNIQRQKEIKSHYKQRGGEYLLPGEGI